MKSIQLEIPFFEELNEQLKRIDSKLESIQKEKTFNRKVLTSKEAALALRVTTRTLSNYRDQGIIPFIQFGREIRYKAEDIQQFLLDHYVKATMEGRRGE